MQIIIRKAAPDDLPAILALYGQPDLDDGSVLSPQEARPILDKIGRYPDYSVYVAVLDGEIVGTFALLIMDNLAHRGTPSGVVEDVAVRPDCQGKGIGRKMMRFARERCRELGCYKLTLSSHKKREKAHRFYESLGFKKHGYSFLVEP